MEIKENWTEHLLQSDRILFFVYTFSTGDPLSPIKLPVDMPFYLYAHSSAGCQKVQGAMVKEENVFVNTPDGGKLAGTVPFGLNEGGTRLVYCYYTPGK